MCFPQSPTSQGFVAPTFSAVATWTPVGDPGVVGHDVSAGSEIVSVQFTEAPATPRSQLLELGAVADRVGDDYELHMPEAAPAVYSAPPTEIGSDEVFIAAESEMDDVDDDLLNLFEDCNASEI